MGNPSEIPQPTAPPAQAPLMQQPAYSQGALPVAQAPMEQAPVPAVAPPAYAQPPQFAPPQPVYQQPVPQVNPVIINNQTNAGANLNYPNAGGAIFRNVPINVTCTHCHQPVTTEVNFESGAGTWLICCGIWLFTGCCCCIPFCVDSCRDAIHRCPSCKKVVGRRNIL